MGQQEDAHGAFGPLVLSEVQNPEDNATVILHSCKSTTHLHLKKKINQAVQKYKSLIYGHAILNSMPCLGPV